MATTLEKGISREVEIPAAGFCMRASLEQPMPGRGMIVFANGFGSRRFHESNRIVADALESADFATLMVNLLAPEEEEDPQFIFDTSLPARRLAHVVRWLKRHLDYGDWPLGIFGSGTCGAVVLEIAACMPEFIDAVVTRAGRPDLAETWLPWVEAPTEMIVGSEDLHILAVNQRAMGRLECPCQLVEVPGASHLFSEPGAMDTVATLARAWFERNMAPSRGWEQA